MRILYYLRRLWSEKLIKQVLVLAAITLLATQSHAQMKLGDNPNTINASALLELESTSKGLLLPRMTNVQMQSITTPAPGMAVYVTDSACIYVYRTGGWYNMCIVSTLTNAEIIRIIAENAHNQPLIDSIYHAVLLRSGNLTSPSGLITVVNGTQSLLKSVTVDVNTDSIINLVARNGKNVTGVNPISVIGGTRAGLQPFSISIDSNRLVPNGGAPGQILIKDSSGSSVWGIAAGDNWGSQVIFHNNTLAGNGTATSPIGVDSFGLAVTIVTHPVRDSILSILNLKPKDISAASSLVTVTGGVGASLQNVSIDINKDSVVKSVVTSTVLSDTVNSIIDTRAHNLTAASTLVTVTGGTGATLTNATVDVNKDSLISTVVNSPVMHDSIIKIVADNSNKSPLRDSIFSTVVAQGKDITALAPMIITGGTGASLRPVSVSIDSNRLVPNGGTPGQVLIKDSSGSSVWGIAAGDNWGSQVIFHNTTLAGNGTASSPIGVDTFGLATILSTSPSRDTILSIVGANAKDLTAGSSLVTVTGGTGATLKNTSVDINRDTVISAVSTSTVLHDTVNSIIDAHAKDITAASTLVTVTGGTGASLQSVTLDVNRDTVIHAVVTSTVVTDTVNSIIDAHAHDLTAGSGLVTITGGAGATLTNASVDINRDTVISTVINSPVIHDSIIKIVADNSNKSPLRDSIFGTVVAQGKDITAIAPMTVTGGTGASLRPVSVSIDSNRIVPLGGTPGQVLVRDSSGGTVFTTISTGDNWGTQVVNHNTTLTGTGTATSPLGIDTAGLAVLLPTSPISDTIVSIVGSRGKNLTSTQPALIIANGIGTTLKNTSLTLDSIELIRLLIRSHLADSLMNFKGFNVTGNATANSFLNLNVTIGSSSDLPADYSLQNLPNTTTFPNFNDFGVIANPSSVTEFTAPVSGYYQFNYSVTLVVNPSLLSVGGSFVWGAAIVKTNGTPTVLQSTRTTQTLAAGALGLGVATVGSNAVNALVKLNAGDKVSVGVGSTSGITVGLVSSTSTIQHFSGYWVK